MGISKGKQHWLFGTCFETTRASRRVKSPTRIGMLPQCTGLTKQANAVGTDKGAEPDAHAIHCPLSTSNSAPSRSVEVARQRRIATSIPAHCSVANAKLVRADPIGPPRRKSCTTLGTASPDFAGDEMGHRHANESNNDRRLARAARDKWGRDHRLLACSPSPNVIFNSIELLALKWRHYAHLRYQADA
ncbi:hypothetical protein SAMN05216330_11834 [Bradyrhizobium sp. Ghvi]|nr:hypothetical protein SAMN05216330_11834 [Bradyrhizobium sp. Ghvi]